MFNFKSSGTLIDSKDLKIKNKKKFTPIGLKTPLQVSGDANLYETHSNPLDQIKDNFKNLILTNKGERLGRYKFGTSLNEVLFDATALDNFEEIISKKISESAEKYIPQISISKIDVKIVNTGESFVALAQNEILTINYPRNNFNSFGNDESSLSNQLAKIKITITYNVPILNVNQQKIAIQTFVGG